MKNYAIILASGSGSRYGDDIPKQFVKIAGKTILEHTIEIFEKTQNIDEIIVVITPQYKSLAKKITDRNNYKKISKILEGGALRKDSSYIGISSIEDDEANVLIHDCARPFLTQEIISSCIEALKTHSAIDVAIPATDTIIKVEDEFISSIPKRSELMCGQTPQCFKLSLIKQAHKLAKNDNNFTDDCGLIVKYNLAPVYVVKGSCENIKVTYKSDIYIADRLFQLRNTDAPENNSLENLKDKVIVTFGATSGIGECINRTAEKYGAKTYTLSTRLGCDITDFQCVQEKIKEIYKKENKIDYVINSAGVLKIRKIQKRSIEDIKREIDINYIGAINIVKSSIEYLKKSKGAFLLFSSSSYTRGRALYSTYSSSKAAVVNLVQALSEELSEDDIRINAINPERTKTPMRLKAFGDEPEDSLLDPNTVAIASRKVLLSDLTGQTIDVRR